MIQIIIFSFNRALQLDALLNSIVNYWKGTDYKLSVLYNTTSESYQQGYDQLKQMYPNFSFVKETSKMQLYPLKDYFSFFNLKKIIKYPKVRKQRSNFRSLLNQILKDSDCPYTMFLTDDSAFIKGVNLKKEVFDFIDRNPVQNSISLRLGIMATTPTPSLKLENGRIIWNFNEHRADRSWGYNFSVDGHIYNTSLMRKLLGSCVFNNPSYLEGHICDYVIRHKLLNQCMTYEHPFMLSFPINMVQDVVVNESLGVSEKELNKYFLEGERLIYPIPNEIVEFQQYPKYLELEGKSGKRKLVIQS